MGRLEIDEWYALFSVHGFYIALWMWAYVLLYFVLQEYKKLFDGAGTNPGEKTLEDKFFEYEVRIECGYDSDKSFVQH